MTKTGFIYVHETIRTAQTVPPAFFYTLNNLVVEIRFNSEILLLNSEEGATNLLIVDISLFRSEFSLHYSFF